MSSSITIEEFLQRVRKSGLFSDAHLDKHLDHLSFSASDRPDAVAQEMVRVGLVTDYQARLLLNDPDPDFLIAGKYRILDLLGRGGMGSVFLCEHLRMRRLVAVKVLPPDSESDPVILARFEREAQAVAAFDHPNVVHAYDVDQADGRHFLVMEFIDGVDLHTFVANHGPMSVERAAWCVIQTARGLHHAWLAGWVHRDIKPGNLLMDRGGCIKILDMGLARIFDSATSHVTSLFRDDSILGTADYLSPEQSAGNNDTDIRADIYSLGATFYFLLTGNAPFEDVPVSQKLLGHRTVTPMPVCLRRPEVPEAMGAILARMMEKDPRQRYSTPNEVAELLLPFCPSPPLPPSEMQMPEWSPAVAERIRNCQAPSERLSPKTVPLVIKTTPKTGFVRSGKTAKPTEYLSKPKSPSRSILVPRWLAIVVLALLLLLSGWTIFREATRPHYAMVGPGWTHEIQLIRPYEAEAHIDKFVGVEMTIDDTEAEKSAFLYTGPTRELKAFFVQIDGGAISRGRFNSTEPEQVHQQYRGKRVRVFGRVLRKDDSEKPYRTGAPYINVFDPKQIQIIDEPRRK